MNKEGFYTFTNYLKSDTKLITASMEDYIEMIYRLSRDQGFTRTSDLSRALNVQPASITKMVKKLDELNLSSYEKYGYIRLTKTGEEYGEYLLTRHNTVYRFLEIIGVKDSLLEETEKIEHVLNKETLEKIIEFIDTIDKHPEILKIISGNH